MNEPTLERALACLAPALGSLVVVGGTAHRLFPLHELGSQPDHELLTTEDVDLAAPLELGWSCGVDLLGCLRAAGFEEHIRGAEHPAHTYRLPPPETSYLQFIAPLTGSGAKRDGSRDRTLRFAGIHAEKLRDVDLLLHAPWTLPTRAGGTELSLRIVNPAAYLVQKLLVIGRRREKRPKDLLYVFETLTLFADSLDELRSQVPELLPRLNGKRLERVRKAARDHCFTATDAAREAVRIAGSQRSNPPDSRQLVAACTVGLQKIFGDTVGPSGRLEEGGPDSRT